MADLMSGPNAPLTRALIFCGWRCITTDWLINPQHDLANPDFQQELHEMLKQADCICAALDCSTKSRAREIPRRFEDGRPAPKPLRSDDHPTGLPNLRGRDLRRVTRDNQACDFVLQEIQNCPIEVEHHFVRIQRGAFAGSFSGRSRCWVPVTGTIPAMQPAASWAHGANSSDSGTTSRRSPSGRHSNVTISTIQMSGSRTRWTGSGFSPVMRRLSTRPHSPSLLRFLPVGGRCAPVELSYVSLVCHRLRPWADANTGYTTILEQCAAGL